MTLEFVSSVSMTRSHAFLFCGTSSCRFLPTIIETTTCYRRSIVSNAAPSKCRDATLMEARGTLRPLIPTRLHLVLTTETALGPNLDLSCSLCPYLAVSHSSFLFRFHSLFLLLSLAR